MFLGVIIYVATDTGRIKIEVNDPRAVIKIDGKEVLIEVLGEPITLRAGDHDYQVKWSNGEFRTNKFVVRRGDNENLRIEYRRTRPRVVPPKDEKATADKPEGPMKGDEDEKPRAVAQGPTAKDSPVGEGGQPARPAAEEGKAAPTEKGKEAGVAIAEGEPKEAIKSPSTKSTTSPKSGRNGARKGGGNRHPHSGRCGPLRGEPISGLPRHGALVRSREAVRGDGGTPRRGQERR